MAKPLIWRTLWYSAGPSFLLSRERRWWRKLDWWVKIIAVVAVSWSLFTLLYAVSDSCRRDQTSTACWITSGSLAETVNKKFFGSK